MVPNKFHGAQTISLSVVLGLATLILHLALLLFVAEIMSRRQTARQREHDSLGAALFAGTILYWIAGLASILYPGTDWVDPEFGPSGVPPAQIPVFVGFASAAVLGWMLDRRH
ncbi:hypothetical protein MYCTH_2313128 [Thermothelomyces thermophilus ATCC 42464]|uniref:Uncharacterized protein n=1 Tax=Thermothelomyces thermophilus (strain ATCC 42464 / BCRC 31852 / DSM 1799) TaxID=573729 RepID=G2QNU3_THET4|nr:uncharacterized protein MYCTH_2313128 [Thermothelomyces thermophilus ATCC 42464]AEO62119.1 hypothetical protein MYCTH_2313128 [Thermothelomyces thermophilus ATCC 42464]